MEIDADILAKYKKRKVTGKAKQVRESLGFREPENVGPWEALSSAAQAPLDMAAGAANLVPGLQQQFGDPNKPFRIPLNENPNELYYALGGMATPFGAGIKAAGAIPKVGKYVKSAHEGAKGLVNKLLPSAERSGLAGTMGREALKGAGRGAGASAAIGETLRAPGTEQYENLGFNTGLGALLGGTMGGIRGAIPGAANRTVRTSERAYKETPNLIRSPQEVSEISKNVPEGLRVNLGEYTKQPDTKAFYTDVLGNAPFSPVKGNERKALSAATEKSNAFVNDLLGGTHPSEVSNTVSRSIKGKGEANKAEAGKYYGRAFKQADKANFKITETPSLDKGIQQILKEHDKGWLKSFSPEDISILNRLSGKLDSATEERIAKEMLNYSDYGKDVQKIIENQFRKKYVREPLSLEQAKNLRSKLASEARKAEKAMEDEKARAFGNAGNLLNDEISKQIKKTGSKALEKNWNQANKTYREEYVPYGKTKAFRPIMKGEKNVNPEELLKSAKFNNGRPGNSFAKVYEDLSAKDKNLVAYSLLNKAVEKESGKIGASPSGLAKRAGTLSPEMKAKAFSPEQLKELGTIGSLSKITKSGEKSGKSKGASTLNKLSPDTLYGDVKKHVLGWLSSPIANTGAKIMTSPAVRKAYETGKPLSYDELMKEFNILNKGKYLGRAIERTAYTTGKDKSSEKR